METKKWYESKTVWLSLLQSVIGILASLVLVIQSGLTPEAIGAFIIALKGLLDLKVRFITTKAIQ